MKKVRFLLGFFSKPTNTTISFTYVTFVTSSIKNFDWSLLKYIWSSDENLLFAAKTIKTIKDFCIARDCKSEIAQKIFVNNPKLSRFQIRQPYNNLMIDYCLQSLTILCCWTLDVLQRNTCLLCTFIAVSRNICWKLNFHRF